MQRPRHRTHSSGLTRLRRAWFSSWRGLRQAAASEQALRQELVLAAVLLPLALWLGHDGAERALLAGSVLLVLVVELLNTAIEYTVDRISLDSNDLSAAAKDIGSAAVLLTLALGALTWLLVLAPRWC